MCGQLSLLYSFCINCETEVYVISVFSCSLGQGSQRPSLRAYCPLAVRFLASCLARLCEVLLLCWSSPCVRRVASAALSGRGAMRARALLFLVSNFASSLWHNYNQELVDKGESAECKARYPDATSLTALQEADRLNGWKLWPNLVSKFDLETI
jgi:hypothetical protein